MAAPARPATELGLEVMRPQDLAVTLLGSYVRTTAPLVWSGGLVELLEEFGFTTAAARVALARLVKRGLLERIREGRLAYYRLSERTEHLLAEGDRRIFSLGRQGIPWDDTWTILWHYIPEAQRVERARLGRRLRFLGFGSVQDGTWISPHGREGEVAELIEDLGVREFVGVLVGRPAAGLPLDRLIERAWDLEELCELYQLFASEFAGYRQPGEAGALDDREAFELRTRLVHGFRQFPFIDPEVPDELMPRPEARRQAADTFHAVYEALAEPAQRHFDQVTVPVSR